MKLINSLIFKLTVLLVIIIVLLAAVDNSQDVALKFLDFSTFELPLLGWVIIAFVSGIICASVVNMWTNTRLKLKIRSANKQVNQANDALDEARGQATDEVVNSPAVTTN